MKVCYSNVHLIFYAKKTPIPPFRKQVNVNGNYQLIVTFFYLLILALLPYAVTKKICFMLFPKKICFTPLLINTDDSGGDRGGQAGPWPTPK
jgi:hypothetical protein